MLVVNLKSIAYFLFFSILTAFISSCNTCIGVDCPNESQCDGGQCVCSDGVNRLTCKLDTCFPGVPCEHGNCEYGFCNCAENWSGAACDSLLYEDHEGDYFGPFICNNYQEVSMVQVRRTSDQRQFKILEPAYDYAYLADFIDANRFQVAKQVNQTTMGPLYIQGYGRIEKGVMHLNTTYSNDSIAVNCAFEGELQ